jgi:polysaccharide chain length determinant protein (PEP-CTERM system associated)
MSVEFRQRTPGEYAQILWRRKWLIILPTLAISAAVALVVWRLPNAYESSTLLIVKPATISTALVAPLSDTDLTMRINTINNMVRSRATLQPLIEKYDIYRAERLRGEPMEAMVDRMQRAIDVRLDKSRDITNAFRISFRARDPRIAQAVTAELAAKFISAHTSDVTNQSAVTKQFFQREIEEAQNKLNEIDKRRVQFMQANIGTLPTEAQFLISQLGGLRERQKALITEIGRMRDSLTIQNNQLNELTSQVAKEKINTVESLGDPKGTPAYGMLLQRKTQLENEIKNMLTTLTPKNPDVIAKQEELAAVKRDMDDLVREAETKKEEIRKRLEGFPDQRISGLKNNIQLLSSEIARQQKLLDDTDKQIAAIEARINSVPGVEVQLDALNREYGTQKAIYDDLLEKQQKADLAANVATNQQSESLTVIDPANLPQRPVAPNRAQLIALGVALGLALGFLLAIAVEVPRLLTIQTADDAEHYTGMQVLVAVPEMMTVTEERRMKMRRALLAAAGVVVTLLSVPALAYLLKFSQVFDRFAA